LISVVPFVSALAERIQVAMPLWLPPKDALDDWQTSAWDDLFPSVHYEGAIPGSADLKPSRSFRSSLCGMIGLSILSLVYTPASIPT